MILTYLALLYSDTNETLTHIYLYFEIVLLAAYTNSGKNILLIALYVYKIVLININKFRYT